MRAFKAGQRVVVDQPETYKCLRGKTGTVKRQSISGLWWVRMDEALPDALRSFPADDERANEIALYPEECMPC